MGSGANSHPLPAPRVSRCGLENRDVSSRITAANAGVGVERKAMIAGKFVKPAVCRCVRHPSSAPALGSWRAVLKHLSYSGKRMNEEVDYYTPIKKK